MTEALIPVSGLPLSATFLQPATWGCHLRMSELQLCRDAVPTLPKAESGGVACVVRELDTLYVCSVLSKRPEWSRDQS